MATAPGSVATANGQNLAATSAAPLVPVSPGQIEFLAPSTVAAGTAQIVAANGAATQTAGNVEIATLGPGILTMNGLGLSAAQAIQVAAQ